MATNEPDRRDDPDRKFLQSREWRERIRPRQLERQPLCEFCQKLGTLTVAESVDHIIRPRGDPVLQRDTDNFRSLCHNCHLAKSNWERHHGDKPFRLGVGLDGWPIDIDPLKR